MFGGTNNQYGNSTFGQSFKGINQQSSSDLLTPNNSMNPYQTYSQNKSFLNVDLKNPGQIEQYNRSQIHGTSVKYNPVIEKGGFSSPFTEKFNCLGCMDAYKNKSLEELRWEDYQCNEKEVTVPLPSKPLSASLLNTSNSLSKPALFPVSKSTNDNFLSNTNQPHAPSLLTDPPQLITSKSVHNFSAFLNSQPAVQNNFLKKNDDSLNTFTSSYKSTSLKPVDSKSTTLLAPHQNLSSNDQHQATSIFPSVTNSLQAPGDEFSNNVQKIFQPFPRRDFLASIGSNLSLESLNTDLNTIDDILNEVKAVDNYADKKPLTRNYPPYGANNIGKSFFEDVAKYVPSNKSNRCLVLNKKPDKNDNVQSSDKDVGILNTFSSSKEFLEQLQITVAKTVNVHCNTRENKNEEAEIGHTENISCCENLELNQDTKLEKSLLRLKSLKSSAQVYFEKNLDIKSKAKRCSNSNEGRKSRNIGTAVSAYKLTFQLSEMTQTKDFNVAEKGIQVDHDTVQERGDSYENNKRCNVKLTKIGYYTEPPFHELYKYVDDDYYSCIVDDFVIGRVGYGKIRFLDSVDLFNLDLDDIVDIDYRNVTVYPDDDKKPPVGEGLNVKAEITMDKIWPVDRNTDAIITDTKNITKINFINKLKRLSEKQNASFVNYLPDSGSWIFNVKHF